MSLIRYWFHPGAENDHGSLLTKEEYKEECIRVHYPYSASIKKKEKAAEATCAALTDEDAYVEAVAVEAALKEKQKEIDQLQEILKDLLMPDQAVLIRAINEKATMRPTVPEKAWKVAINYIIKHP